MRGSKYDGGISNFKSYSVIARQIVGHLDPVLGVSLLQTMLFPNGNYYVECGTVQRSPHWRGFVDVLGVLGKSPGLES